MANKRMFSKDIVQSDAFLDMPTSSQALYFHLGMEADDDGFLGNPKRLVKTLGSSDDDLKILAAKRFVLIFESGVLVIKHHRINNNWDKYNCKRTVYTEELSRLFIKPNKSYTLDSSQGVPVQSENSLKTVFRIEENRIDIPAAIAAKIEVVKDEPERKSSALQKSVREGYDRMVKWAEVTRGFPFVGKTKQYKALKLAKENRLTSTQLKERWLEMAEDDFWQKTGFDWMNVVTSFNKKRHVG